MQHQGVKDVQNRPAYLLHTVVARLDEAADAMLRDEHGISYARFLTLLTVERLGAPTQRELAAAHGVSDPAMSRTVASLAAEGHLDVITTPGRGHRRSVTLSPAGERLVEQGSDLLESAFAALAGHADVRLDDVSALSTALLSSLDAVSVR